MNDVEMALLRHKERTMQTVKKKDDKKISRMFTKVLLSIILVLASTIYIKLSPENLANFKKVVLESNLTFTKINDWYHNVFGSILPTVKEPDEQVVSGDIINTPEPYLDGYKVVSSKGSPIEVLTSGLFVYQGEKEGYGNVFIIQGVNGVDVWYGMIGDCAFKLYDYVEAGDILGNTTEDYYFLAFKKEDKFISYEEYQNTL